MDGRMALSAMLEALDEPSGFFSSNWLPYRFLDLAAIDFVRLTHARKSTTTLTTVAYQQKYDLPADFIGLYVKDKDDYFVLKYFDGDDYYWPSNVEEEDVYRENLIEADPDAEVSGSDIAFVDSDPDTITSTSTDFDAAGFVANMTITTNALGNVGPFTINTVAANTLTLVSGDSVTAAAAGSSITIRSCTTRKQPINFAIIDKASQRSIITGTTTSDGSATAGKCTLTDTAATFATTELVYPRAIIHNTSDISDGIVLSVTSATALVTALFGGTDNEWDSQDAYVIQPNPIKQIYLDYPSAYAGHTITVPYLCMPNPVFSDYDFWEFPERDCQAICYEAASLYKSSKGDFQEAARLHGQYLEMVGKDRTERNREGKSGHVQFQQWL